MAGSFFVELAIVLLIAFAIAFALSKIRQPLLIGYILAGILVGPIFFNLLSSHESFLGFSQMGIAFLLFIVGLHLNVRLIKEVGLVSLVTGLGQIIFTTLFGIVLVSVLGYGWIPSLLIATGLTFSSTIIIVKLLSDKEDLDKLYGKISLGFLLVQDFAAVLILLVISTLMSVGTQAVGVAIIQTIILGGLGIGLTLLLAKKVLPSLLEGMARSSELLFVFIIVWCFGIAVLFKYLGLSMEVGALLAGVALASSPFQHDISSRIRPLRDFFIIIFFIFLGYEMIPQGLGLAGMVFAERVATVVQVMAPAFFDAIWLSLFVLIGNPIIVFILIVVLGYSARTGFLAGLTVSQISEFSIILALLAKDAGMLTTTDVSLITFVALITITCSTYLVIHGDRIFVVLAPFLQRFEKKRIRDALQGIPGKKHDVLLFGVNRVGHNLVSQFRKERRRYLAIDHNPKVIKRLVQHGYRCVYGDAGNIEFLSEFNLRKVRLLVSTIPDYEVGMILLDALRSQNKKATVFLTAEHIDDALDLYKQGADYVILPHFLGGQYVSTLIEKQRKNPKALIKERIRQLYELGERKEFGHEHPRG